MLTTKNVVAGIGNQKPTQYSDQQQPPAISCSAACSSHWVDQHISVRASSMHTCDQPCRQGDVLVLKFATEAVIRLSLYCKHSPEGGEAAIMMCLRPL